MAWLRVGLAAVGAVALYVLVHEQRRKSKKAKKALLDKPIQKELLLQILSDSAEASKNVVARIRAEVLKLQEAKNLSTDQASMIFQQNFEHSLDQVIAAVRNQHGVSEKAMDSSFKIHQTDPEVQAAIGKMRQLNAAPTTSAGNSSAVPGTSQAERPVEVPSWLSREKLKEIMHFNAVTLEKELEPIKNEVERLRKAGKSPQVDPQALMEVQSRISAKVEDKYQVNDKQVMAAVEKYNAKADPAFKETLQRIANTLNSTLG